MNELLRTDSLLRPDLFIWNGAIERKRLENWVRERHLTIPDDLVEFWSETGGGEIFETETVLGPFGDPERGEDLDSVNEHHRGRGMDQRFLVVHHGSALSAVRLHDRKWVVLDPDTYSQREVYGSLAEWYREVLRSEFADRYGLPLST